jgi:hypothetical protein
VQVEAGRAEQREHAVQAQHEASRRAQREHARPTPHQPEQTRSQ